MKGLYIIFLILISFSLNGENPLEVVVIGGGPAGLATAIEAHLNGAEVTVIEKRDNYSRDRVVFLYGSSEALLQRWNVTMPVIRAIPPGFNSTLFVTINELENALDCRVKELGIKKIKGEFLFLEGNEAVICTGGEVLHLPYDYLIAADGVHSSVREHLGISVQKRGEALGSVAYFYPKSSENSSLLPFCTGFYFGENYFLKKCHYPLLFVVFAQHPTDIHYTQEEFFDLLHESSWDGEVNLLEQEESIFIGNIPIELQQAEIFYDQAHSTLLVGDAAATGSFFQGKGANTALLTAELAGQFFKNVQSDKQQAIVLFNKGVKEVTDLLIRDSQFLFK